MPSEKTRSTADSTDHGELTKVLPKVGELYELTGEPEDLRRCHISYGGVFRVVVSVTSNSHDTEEEGLLGNSDMVKHKYSNGTALTTSAGRSGTLEGGQRLHLWACAYYGLPVRMY